MSSHDCRLEGDLTLKDGVKEADVRIALAALLAHFGADYDVEANEEGSIQLDEDGGTLSLCINFRGQGNGCYDAKLAAGLNALGPIIDGGQTLLVHDFDTGDTDVARVPKFLGTDIEKTLARLRYGIDELETWVKPLIGDAAFEWVVSFIREQTIVDAKPKPTSRSLKFR